MADTRKKLLEKQLTKAEQAKADRLEATNKYMDTYKVSPNNWLAKLGQRDAQKFVLKHPTSQDVSSWSTPAQTLGMTANDFSYYDDPKERAKAFARIKKERENPNKTDDEKFLIKLQDETGFDYSNPEKIAKKIAIGPWSISSDEQAVDDFVPEHEFMHRGQMVSTHVPIELDPYLYSKIYGAGIHRNGDPTQPFEKMYRREPNRGDISDLAQDQQKAKDVYIKKYTSGPMGGMPDEPMGGMPDESFQPKEETSKTAKIINLLKTLIQ